MFRHFYRNFLVETLINEGQITSNMSDITLYHYVKEGKYVDTIERKLLIPTSPFNSRVSEGEWQRYASQFSFPVALMNTCCFFKQNPENWKEYGLFDLLIEEFSGGDYLLPKFDTSSLF